MSESWERAVFIPACREFELLPGCIENLSEIAPPKTLLVLVINARSNASKETHLDNDALFSWLTQFPHKQLSSDRWMFHLPNLDILVLDRWTPPFRLNPKQGVGTARALGAEIICSLYHSKRLRHPWIWSTDADARFSRDYLAIPAQQGTCIVPYIHTDINKHRPPIALEIYEYSLRYYTLGLHYAASPYAYPTIGSTIVISVDAYEKSHGFPHRMAGEDFYLLAKASKVSPIHYLDRSPIRLLCRASDRVPFGTGQGMASIEKNNNTKELYHPKIFEDLQRWIHFLNTSPDETLLDDLFSITKDFPHQKKLISLLRQPAKGQRIRTRRHEWFDSFRTLKWIHHMRDTKWGTLPYKEAIEIAPFTCLSPADTTTWQEQLRNLEEARISSAGRALFHV